MQASPIEFNLSAADLAILVHGCFYVYVVPSARRRASTLPSKARWTVKTGIPESERPAPKNRAFYFVVSNNAPGRPHTLD